MYEKICSVVVATTTHHHDLIDSIILNKGKDLKKCELIFVVDGGDNNTREEFNSKIQILKTKKIKLKVSYLGNTSQVGPGVARNHGINISNGQYIYFADDDDIINWSNLSEIIDCLEEKNELTIVGFRDTSNVMSNYSFLERFTSSNYSSFNIMQNIIEFGYNPVQLQQFIFSRSFIKNKQLTFSKTFLAEDVSFIAIAFLLSTNIFIFRKEIYIYQSRANSTKGIDSIQGCTDYFGAITHIIRKCRKEVDFNNDIRSKFAQYILSRLIVLFRLRLYSTSQLEIFDTYTLFNEIQSTHKMLGQNVELRVKTNNINSAIIDLFDDIIKKIIKNPFTSISQLIEEYIQDDANIFIVCYGPLGKAAYDEYSGKISKCFVVDNRAKELRRNNPRVPFIEVNDILIKADETKSNIILICNPNIYLEQQIENKLKDKLETKIITDKKFVLLKAYSLLLQNL